MSNTLPQVQDATLPSPKNAGGRPLKFKTVKHLQAAIDLYFDKTPIEEWMITGLALHLGTTRDVLMDYQNKDGFSHTVKRAKLMVEMSYEKRNIKRGNAGDIFALKQFGWKDKTEITGVVAHFDMIGYIQDVEKRNSQMRAQQAGELASRAESDEE